jgi:hypothetical protein
MTIVVLFLHQHVEPSTAGDFFAAAAGTTLTRSGAADDSLVGEGPYRPLAGVL